MDLSKESLPYWKLLAGPFLAVLARKIYRSQIRLSLRLDNFPWFQIKILQYPTIFNIDNKFE